MQETKETSSDQTSTIQEMTCRHQRRHLPQCIAFEKNFLRSFIQNDFSTSRRDFSRRKENKRRPSVIVCQFCSASVLLKM